MKYIIAAFLLMGAFVAHGQSVVPLRGDTIKIYKAGGYADLVLQNRTKDSLGLMVNIGNGLTKFIRAKKVDDTHILVGLDTLEVGGGSGTDSAIAAQFGIKLIIIGTTRYLLVDSNLVLSHSRGIKLADSLAAVFNASSLLKVNKTDSAGPGYATFNRLRKVADSLALLINKKVNISDSAGAGYATFNRLRKVADSLGALITGGGGSSYTPYTFVFVSGGQSNAHGQAEDAGAGTDTTSSPKLLVFDRFNRIWRQAYLGTSPMSTSAPTNYSPTAWFFFGKKWLSQHPNDTFRVVPTWADATAIAQWFNGTTKGAQMDTMTTVYNAALAAAPWAMTHVDLFWWDQGESDPGTTFATYTAAFDSVKANLRRLTNWTKTANMAVQGMPDTLSGAPTSYQAQEPNLKTYDYGLDEYVGFSRSDSVSVNGGVGNHLHYNSYGLWKIGTQRIWAAWLSHPSRSYERGNGGVAAGSILNLSRLDIVHNSPPGAGAQIAGVYTTNQSAAGRGGYYGYSNDSSGKFYVGITGTSATYAAASGMIIGTETAHDVSFFRNFTLYMQLLSSGITVPQRTTFTSTGQQQITNATTSQSPGIAINGDGSNFGQWSIQNSATALIPNHMIAYFKNNYKIILGANGTSIIDTSAALHVPTSTLDVWGSFGLRTDSVNGANYTMHQRTNTVLFNTGSTIDTLVLQTPAGILGRRITVKKTDAGSGTVFIKPLGGQTIDRSTAGILLSGQNAYVRLISDGITGWYTDQPPAASVSYYQTVQSNTSSQTQRAKLNFSTDFTVADNSGNGSTDISFPDATRKVAGADFTGQTGGLSIATYTPSVDGSYQFSAYINVTALTGVTAVAGVQVIYTDPNSNVKTVFFYNGGSSTSGLTATGDSFFAPIGEVRVKGGTTITMSASLANVSSITYDAGGSIIKVR